MPTRTTIFATNDNVTANDLNSLAGAWNSYTPQVDQGASTNIAKTINYAKYLQFGKLVIVQMRLSMTGTGTAGASIVVSLPVTPATSSVFVGAGWYSDNGTGGYPATVYIGTATGIALMRSDTANSASIGVDPSLAVASGDEIRAFAFYEAA